ncbi:hypothetical protein BGZ83_003741 [Gryganskiella cystojenkinii]|nr:hypothetical protein BGZ83_003741 [Gryganskiella cystojenkinii]
MSHAILQCLQLNRLCHQTLLQRVWSVIEIEQDTGPDMTSLIKHASLVRDLSIIGDDMIDLINETDLFFPSLSTLHLDQELGDRRLVHESSIRIVQLHRSTLTSLTVESVTSEELMGAVAACSSLQILKIESLSLASPIHWMDHYESLWSHLRILTLGGNWFNSYEGEHIFLSKFETVPSTALQQLTFHCQDYDPLLFKVSIRLIQKSPRLIRLKWVLEDEDDSSAIMNYVRNNYGENDNDSEGTLNHDIPLGILADAIRRGDLDHWKDLQPQQQHLRYLSLPSNNFSNQDLSLVLQTVTNLRKLDLNKTNFDSQSWKILQQELPRYSLRSLNLQSCNSVTGAMVHEILCTIPTLSIFEADFVKTSNLVEDTRPLVCSGIRELCLTFVLPKDDDSDGNVDDGEDDDADGGVDGGCAAANSLVLSRLSTLTRLEYLDMNTLDFGFRGRHNSVDALSGKSDPKRAVQLSLDQGLEDLKSLKRLRSFYGPGEKGFRWRVKEVRWALKHWPKLEKLSMMPIERRAKALLKAKGIYLTAIS